jgi:Leucine-rich repeat (LRR) protein
LQQIRSLAPLTSLSSDPAATPPLRELYCAANKVTAIEGLSALTALTLLELGSNRVRNIEGLEVGLCGGSRVTIHHHQLDQIQQQRQCSLILSSTNDCGAAFACSGFAYDGVGCEAC